MSILAAGKKTAIVLFNLGGPDDLDAVVPFLKNLFSDPLIIRLPWLLRYLIARLIAWRRGPIARDIYRKIGGRTPILPETYAQAEALERALSEPRHGKVKTFVAMRYWHPFAHETVEEVKRFAPDHILLLPLYPQFSTTTTRSSIEDWHRAAAKGKLDAPTSEFCCYPRAPGLIAAFTDAIKDAYYEMSGLGPTRILFSAHGLPQKIVDDGDPYAAQVAMTVERIIDVMQIEGLDYLTCFQSRVGPMQWLKPATDHEIIRAGEQGLNLVVVPIAFVSEHSETLVELDIEYAHLAKEHGVKHYARVPTPATHPAFIEGLARLCESAETTGIIPPPAARSARPNSANAIAANRAMRRSLSRLKSVMNDLYPWALAFHIISFTCWMAGMFYLPRLFVYHCRVAAGSEADGLFQQMERKLLRGIMLPAMLATFAFGLWLVLLNPDYLHHGWLHIKLTLVILGMGGIHGFLSVCRKAFAAGENKRAEKFYRVLNEVPVVLFVVIVLLAVVKPF